MDPKDEAQRKLALCGIESGQVYFHYKGGVYVVIATAITEDTLEPMVVYHSNLKGTNSIRTLANWLENVQLKHSNGVTTVPRFTRAVD